MINLNIKIYLISLSLHDDNANLMISGETKLFVGDFFVFLGTSRENCRINDVLHETGRLDVPMCTKLNGYFTIKLFTSRSNLILWLQPASYFLCSHTELPVLLYLESANRSIFCSAKCSEMEIVTSKTNWEEHCHIQKINTVPSWLSKHRIDVTS